MKKIIIFMLYFCLGTAMAHACPCEKGSFKPQSVMKVLIVSDVDGLLTAAIHAFMKDYFTPIVIVNQELKRETVQELQEHVIEKIALQNLSVTLGYLYIETKDDHPFFRHNIHKKTFYANECILKAKQSKLPPPKHYKYQYTYSAA